jgi:hypothetical protein
MHIKDRPTPETNAKSHSIAGHPEVVSAKFARNLERQKAALREALEGLVDCIQETRGKDAYKAVETARATLAATKPKQ